MCRKCFGFTGSTEVDVEEVTRDGVVMEMAAKFFLSYDVLSCRGGLQVAVTAKIKSGWKKLKDIASILCKRVVSTTFRGSMYKS